VIEVVADPAGVVAERLEAAGAAGAHIALTGGSTPREAYERVRDLGTAQLWFGDERCVPPDHEHSNFAMADAALLERLGTGLLVHRMRGEDGPVDGARAYETELRAAFGQAEARLDLVLLGLGPDGHCASLFPGQDSLAERERLVVGVPVAGLEPMVPRITLTLPAINAAREVVFLVAGAGKAEAVARAFGRQPDPSVPAAMVAPVDGTLTVLLDPAAAGRL